MMKITATRRRGKKQKAADELAAKERDEEIQQKLAAFDQMQARIQELE